MAISLTRTISSTPTSTSSPNATYLPTSSSGTHSGVSIITPTNTNNKLLKYSSAPAAVTGYLKVTTITVTNTNITIKGEAGLYINGTWGPSSTATVSITGTGQTSISKTTKPYANSAAYQSFGSFSWSWSRTAAAAAKAIKVSVSFGSSSWYTGDTITITYNVTVPALPTYTITYKANGGTGSDQTQSKTYGVNATLKAANTFTRTNYAFTKWNTAANGSGTSYNAGASYTGNANLTLYAQWQSTYTKPTISNLKAYRVETSGSPDSNTEGKYIYLSFSYKGGTTNGGSSYITPTTHTISCSPSLTITSSHTWSGNSTYTGWLYTASLTSSYTITITLYDTTGGSSNATTAKVVVSKATYPMEISSEGVKLTIPKGVSSSWWNSRDNAIIKQNSIPANTNMYPAISLRTQSGNWMIGTYGERLEFAYITDTTYSAAGASGTNVTTSRVRITSDDTLDVHHINFSGNLSINSSDFTTTLFSRSYHLILSSVSIAASNYTSSTKTFEREGYYPLGIVGWTVSGTGSSFCEPYSLRLSAASTGSATVTYGVRNYNTSAATLSMGVDILWAKII